MNIIGIIGAIVLVAMALSVLIGMLVGRVASRRDERSGEDVPHIHLVHTSHRTAGRAAHSLPSWQLTTETPRRGLSVVRFNAGTVEDTIMFRAITPAGPSTSGDAA